jgi:hypothetical protein
MKHSSTHGCANKAHFIAIALATISILTPAHSDVIRFNGSSFQNPTSAVVRFGFTDLNQGPIALAQPQHQTRAIKRIEPSLAVLADIQRIARRYERTQVLRKLQLSQTDWALFLQAMIRVESAYQHSAKSHVGAIGLAQLMPATANDLNVDPHNRLENLDGGARYLLTQMNTFGDLRLALAAYNAGPGAVQKHNGIPPYKETQTHVVKVMREFARLQAQS